MEEKEGEDGTEEEILNRGYRLGSRDRRCSSSTCLKAFGARSFRLYIPRSLPKLRFSSVPRDWLPSPRERLSPGRRKEDFSRRDRDIQELIVF